MSKAIEIKNLSAEKSVPFCCPVCLVLMRDKSDVATYLEFECCSDCTVEVAYPNREKWKNGWRPPEKELIKIRNKRVSIPSYMRTQ